MFRAHRCLLPLYPHRPSFASACAAARVARLMHSASAAAPLSASASASASAAASHSPPLRPAAVTGKRRLSPTTARREFSLSSKKHDAQGAVAAAASASASAVPDCLTAPLFRPIAMSSSAPLHQSDPVLVLTPLEQRIFSHVLACCAMFGLKTQVRVAGGWVRDKLLGLESEDIDFALDDMSGEEFAGKLSEYLKSVGEKTSSVGVIKVNPDQSKHLATATMKVLDISIDINNFREEIYHEHSRIPEITLSNAKEDALRRDFTVNALYFNIHTNKIEDHVEGLKDLRVSLLRTPRDPSKTFRDDPLRILRAARFAGRFGYRVDDSIREAACTPEIQADLGSKVSRERMGLELGKMLQLHKASCLSFQLLFKQWNLRRIIFEVPEAFSVAPVEEIGPTKPQPIEKRADAAEIAGLSDLCLKAMHLAHVSIATGGYAFSNDDAATFLLSAFLIPYYGYRVEVKKARFNTLVWYLVREALKLPQRDAQLASDLLTQSHQLISASHLHEYAIASADPAALQRLQVVTGGLLRLTAASTIIALRLAEVILQSTTTVPALGSAFDLTLGLPAAYAPSVDAHARLHAYCRWIADSSQLLQLPVWEMKSLASGTEVCAALGINAKGPHVGAIIQRMMDWQMMHIADMIAISPAAPSSSASGAPAICACGERDEHKAGPSCTAAAAPAASVSGAAPAAAAASTPLLTADEVRERCYTWLRTQNLASLAPPERVKGKK